MIKMDDVLHERGRVILHPTLSLPVKVEPVALLDKLLAPL